MDKGGVRAGRDALPDCAGARSGRAARPVLLWLLRSLYDCSDMCCAGEVCSQATMARRRSSSGQPLSRKASAPAALAASR